MKSRGSRFTSLFEDINIHSLSEKDKVGLYYILTYVYYSFPKDIEDARERDFENMVKSDLQGLLDYLFEQYKLCYASWLHFHMSSLFYFASIVLYAAKFDREYILSYTIDETSPSHILIDYKSPGREIRNLKYEFDTQKSKDLLERLRTNIHKWGEFTKRKILPLTVGDNELLAHSALAVALQISPEPTQDHKEWIKTAEDENLYREALGAYNYTSYDSFTAPEMSPLTLVHNSYNEYLRNDKWKGKDLGWKIAALNLLINAQHHSAKMGTIISMGTGEQLNDNELTELSNMNWLPMISDVARYGERFYALKRLYYDWQRHLPWSKFTPEEIDIRAAER